MRNGTMHGSTILSRFEDLAGRVSAPETADGALRAFQRQKVKYFCQECHTLQAVISVEDTKELQGGVAYAVTLACDHRRAVCVLTRKGNQNGN